MLTEQEDEVIFQIIDKIYDKKYWALELITVGGLLICDPSLSHNH